MSVGARRWAESFAKGERVKMYLWFGPSRGAWVLCLGVKPGAVARLPQTLSRFPYHASCVHPPATWITRGVMFWTHSYSHQCPPSRDYCTCRSLVGLARDEQQPASVVIRIDSRLCNYRLESDPKLSQ